jgi:Lon protease-like protein
MPMFPLGTVLLPGGVLPLHVFEPRYRAMVKHCLAGDREFGVVLIARGHEVGGHDMRNDVGTVARMIQVAELADGRYAMITVGMRRIRVAEWLPDDPYPQAEVEEWPDESGAGDLDAMVRSVAATVRRLAALSLELGDAAGDPSQELSTDPVTASYQLASLAPLGPADRYQLLLEPTAAARLRRLADALVAAEEVLRFRLGGTDASAGEETSS